MKSASHFLVIKIPWPEERDRADNKTVTFVSIITLTIEKVVCNS